MADRLDLLDYYTLLGLEQGCTMDAIRDAFHRFALKFHPDNHLGGGPEKQRRAAEIFRRGAEAYRVLSNPETRRAYDEGLARGDLRLKPEADTGTSRRPKSGSQKVNRKAHPFFRKAEQAIKRGDFQSAKLQLKIAKQHDPESELIDARLAFVQQELTK